MAAELVIDYFNYQHGGRRSADYHGNGGEIDVTGLVRESWPATPPAPAAAPKTSRVRVVLEV